MDDRFTMGATTRYYGATTARGARIRVVFGNGSRSTVGKDYSAGDAHRMAVDDAAARSGLLVHDASYVMGAESGRGSVYVVTVSRGDSA